MVAMDPTTFLFVLLSLGSSAAFKLVTQTKPGQNLTVGEDLRLSCQADGYYEYCWWRHQEPGGDQRDCSLEWKYSQVTSPSSLPHNSSYLKTEGLARADWEFNVFIFVII